MHPGDAYWSPLDLAQRIADLLSERQAEDIVLMDIGKVSTFTDYFVIATAGNPRQMNALIDSLDQDLRPEARPRRVEGTPDSGWVLIDFSDAIVHLFSPRRARATTTSKGCGRRASPSSTCSSYGSRFGCRRLISRDVLTTCSAPARSPGARTPGGRDRCCR